MAPLPANNTSRLFIDYRTGDGGNTHESTASIRFAQANLTPLEVALRFHDLLLALGGPSNFTQGWQVFRCRWQEAGNDFSVPIPIPELLAGFLGTNNTNTYRTARHQSNQFRFEGRSWVSGRRVSVSLFGLARNPSDDFRFPASIQWVADALQVLTLAGVAGAFLTVDWSVPVWFDYVNVQQNSYWERAKRT